MPKKSIIQRAARSIGISRKYLKPSARRPISSRRTRSTGTRRRNARAVNTVERSGIRSRRRGFR